MLAVRPYVECNFLIIIRRCPGKAISGVWMTVLRKAVLLAMAALLWFLQTGCEDYYRPVANPIISPGGQPQTAHYAWVVNYNPAGPGTTTEIDVSGDTNLAVTSMGTGSIAEAFPANSLALFVANYGNDSVSEYLPTLSGAVTTISLLPGSHPVYLASGQTANMYVVNSGANSACPNSGSVSTIPVSTLSVSGTTCVGTNPTMAVQSPNNANLYVLNQADGTISVLNGGVVGTITFPSGQSPAYMAVSADGNWIFVLIQDGSNPGTLDIVPAGATSVAASVPLGVTPTFAVADPTLNRLYVTNSGDNTVSVFDTSNVNTSGNPAIPLLATVTVGTYPIGVTPLVSGTLFYVANADANTVTVLSANSFSTLATVALPSGADPVFITSDPTSSKVYVANKGTQNTTIIRTVDNTVSGTIAAPPQQSTCVSFCALQTPTMIVSR
jgi:YVTN family beta-propeller protein